MVQGIYNQLINKETSLALVGLGYVGLPIAVAFANKGLNVVGFDLNKAKIDLYKSGVDPTNEIGNDAIRATTVQFTAEEASCRRHPSSLWLCQPLSIPTTPRT